jgi:hypothetical protein
MALIIKWLKHEHGDPQCLLNGLHMSILCSLEHKKYQNNVAGTAVLCSCKVNVHTDNINVSIGIKSVILKHFLRLWLFDEHSKAVKSP